MSPAAEIGLIAGRELRKSTRSVKGIILMILTLLGSALAVLICIWIESVARDKLHADNTAEFAQARADLLVKGGADAGVANYLSHVPLSLMVFLGVILRFGPALVALLGFDSVSTDMQHRTVRFWTVRSRRWSYLLGKFLGLWGTVMGITLALTILSGIAVLIRGYITFGEFFSWGLRFWLISGVILGTWTAVVTFMSSRFKTPLLALLSTFAAFFMMWLPGFIGWVSRIGEAIQDEEVDSHAQRLISIRWYEYICPLSYDDLLLSPKPLQVAEGFGACAAYMLLFVGLSALLFARRDV